MNARNLRFWCGVRPGSSRFSPRSVTRLQLQCLPLPFSPANGFSWNTHTKSCRSATLRAMAPRLEAKIRSGTARDQAVLDLLREVFRETAPVRFEGNGYSEEWKLEAAKRGLPNLADTPASIDSLADPARTAFLRELGIYSDRELASRFSVSLERYVKTVLLEAETLIEMLSTHVIPAGEKQLVVSAEALRGAPGGVAGLDRRVRAIAAAIADVIAGVEKLKELLAESDGTHDESALAKRLAASVRPAMESARAAADRLEHLVDHELWSTPKYREMLFVR